MLGALQAEAVGTRHPFCLRSRYPGLSYCTFDSYGQCMARPRAASDLHRQSLFAGQTDDPYAYQNRNRP